jgi:hypothetical protein
MNGGVADRAVLLEWLRSELVGPQLADHFPENHSKLRKLEQPLAIQPEGGAPAVQASPDKHTILFHPLAGKLQEIVWYKRESPHQRYGAGLLHPEETETEDRGSPSQAGGGEDRPADGGDQAPDVEPDVPVPAGDDGEEEDDDLEIAARDRFRPSTMAISFHAELPEGARLNLTLPEEVHLPWQQGTRTFPVNGWYRPMKIRASYKKKDGLKSYEMYGFARYPLQSGGVVVSIPRSEFQDRSTIRKQVVLTPTAGIPACPLKLAFLVYSRELDGKWLLTVVLRNLGEKGIPAREQVLFQTHFEVGLQGPGAKFLPYPESHVRFEELTAEEQNLELLYSDQPIWGTGHGCAVAWDGDQPSAPPPRLRAEVLPAVETPSMTPDITDETGTPLRVFLHDLIQLPENKDQGGWATLKKLRDLYKAWIEKRQKEVEQKVPEKYREAAGENIQACKDILARITEGIRLLEDGEPVRRAFELANHAMLLQSLATKKLERRPLVWQGQHVKPEGDHSNPERLFEELRSKDEDSLPSWRAFQIAFLLMSLEGVADGMSKDRTTVDLIWFPTGGGKTEAYLAVAAFAMFHERLSGPADNRSADILMRYTLRMLTTQQFQRAAALVCAMEWLRSQKENGELGERRFSLGLWIGGAGSPNTIQEARDELREYTRRSEMANPLVLSECPWCRAEIGKCRGNRPKGITENQWRELRVRGIEDRGHSVILRCPDPKCFFYRNDEGLDNLLPVEVIDEQIYTDPPSFVVGTADKFAILAYRPEARVLFGYGDQDAPQRPPVLILQDELHLISGPLGTMYGMYEGIIERLCTRGADEHTIKPKIICSTATIRGASEQVQAVFDRDGTTLFPRPAVAVGNSFFGVHARNESNQLLPGRLYLGINATNLPSFQTVQVRNFARVLQAACAAPLDNRDPWWTLLLFYNSLRELGGASTLFSGDIRSRLRFLADRDGLQGRSLRVFQEISSRLQQGELGRVLDRLSQQYSPEPPPAIDVAVASNIIEVGVDIDRLSLMGVLGQPKTTAQYIQVTGRIGRRWLERPGLVLMLYNSSKARDLSHFEQFHSYHRRLYERVEPTSATPFTSSAVRRALGGLIVSFLRQTREDFDDNFQFDEEAFQEALALVKARARRIAKGFWAALEPVIDRHVSELRRKWKDNYHNCWNRWNLGTEDRPVIRTFEQYAAFLQREGSFPVPTSMRQVDKSGGAIITQIRPEDLGVPPAGD